MKESQTSENNTSQISESKEASQVQSSLLTIVDISKKNETEDEEEKDEIAIFDRHINLDEYKKKGFFSCIMENKNHQKALDKLLAEIQNQKELELVDIDTWFSVKIKSIEDRIEVFHEKLKSVEQKRVKFEGELQSLQNKRINIENEIKKLRDSLIGKLQKYGDSKENIINDRILEVSNEFNKIIQLHNEIQDKENLRLNKPEEIEKIKIRKDFLQKIKNKYELLYEDIELRISYLTKVGISAELANTLIAMGAIGTIVSGWFFSIWTGPIPTKNIQGNIVDNSSVLFFIIKNFARFTKQYSFTKIIISISVFVFLIGLLSWLCYWLLIKFSFVKANKFETESDIGNNNEFELDISNHDDFFKGQFKANSWFDFWLKIAPFVALMVILLTVLGRFEDTQQFQQAYDSLVNQNFGTLISILISGLVFLYVTKIMEVRYVKREEANNKEYLLEYTPKMSWEIIIVFILFFGMLMLLILYHSKMSFFHDERKVFIFGFLMSCLATGFCLSYGFRYKELISNYNETLLRLSKINSELQRNGRAIDYLKNELFVNKIIEIQDKMLKMVEARSKLAITVIDGGYKGKYDDNRGLGETNIDSDNEISEQNENTNPISSFLFNFMFPVRSLGNYVKNILFGSSKKKERKDKKEIEFTDFEKLYFPGISLEIEEIKSLIGEKNAELKEVDAELEGYWKEESTYRSIYSQQESIQRRIKKLTDRILTIGAEFQKQKNKTHEMYELQAVLLREGFNNGLWLLKQGDDVREMLTSSFINGLKDDVINSK